MPILVQQQATTNDAVNNPVHGELELDYETATIAAAQATKPPDLLSWKCGVCTFECNVAAPCNCATTIPFIYYKKLFLITVYTMIVLGGIFFVKAVTHGILYDYQSCYEFGGKWREASCLVLSGNLTHGKEVTGTGKNTKRHKFWEVFHEVVVIDPDYGLNPLNHTSITGVASKFPSWAHGEGNRYQCAFSAKSQAEAFLAAYRPNSTHSCFYNPSLSYSPYFRQVSHEVGWLCRGEEYPMWAALATFLLVPSLFAFLYLHSKKRT
jgi:hypothetical protein